MQSVIAMATRQYTKSVLMTTVVYCRAVIKPFFYVSVFVVSSLTRISWVLGQDLLAHISPFETLLFTLQIKCVRKENLVFFPGI